MDKYSPGTWHTLLPMQRCKQYQKLNGITKMNFIEELRCFIVNFPILFEKLTFLLVLGGFAVYTIVK